MVILSKTFTLSLVLLWFFNISFQCFFFQCKTPLDIHWVRITQGVGSFPGEKGNWKWIVVRGKWISGLCRYAIHFPSFPQENFLCDEEPTREYFQVFFFCLKNLVSHFTCRTKWWSFKCFLVHFWWRFFENGKKIE